MPQVRCLKLLVATDSLNISIRGGEHVFFCSRSKLRSYWCFLVLSPKPHDTSLRWVRIGYIDNDCSTYTPVVSGYSTYIHVENAFVDIYYISTYLHCHVTQYSWMHDIPLFRYVSCHVIPTNLHIEPCPGEDLPSGGGAYMSTCIYAIRWQKSPAHPLYGNVDLMTDANFV